MHSLLHFFKQPTDQRHGSRLAARGELPPLGTTEKFKKLNPWRLVDDEKVVRFASLHQYSFEGFAGVRSQFGGCDV